MNTMAVYVQYRVSLLFLFAFVYVFAGKRYSRKRTLFLLGASYTFIAVVEYGIFRFYGREVLSIPMVLFESLVVQGTNMLIHEKRDFKALFVGISAAAYVLFGNVAWEVMMIGTHSVWGAFVVQIGIHSLLLFVMIAGVRKLFLGEEGRQQSAWKLLCILPVLFYAMVYGLTEWPVNLYESPSVIIVVIMVMVLMIVEYCFFTQFLNMKRRQRERESNEEFMEVYSDRIRQEMAQMIKKEEEMAIMRHDMRHYARIMYTYLEEGNIEKAKSMIQETDGLLEQTKPERFCDNLSVNGVIIYCMQLAEQNGVALQLDFQIPKIVKVNEYEYATVVSNLLENAIYGAKEAKKKEDRRVIGRAQQIKEQLVLEIFNYCEEPPKRNEKNGLPVSKRGKHHGYGMKSIQAFAENNDAVFDYSVEGKWFHAKLLVF